MHFIRAYFVLFFCMPIYCMQQDETIISQNDIEIVKNINQTTSEILKAIEEETSDYDFEKSCTSIMREVNILKKNVQKKPHHNSHTSIHTTETTTSLLKEIWQAFDPHALGFLILELSELN